MTQNVQFQVTVFYRAMESQPDEVAMSLAQAIEHQLRQSGLIAIADAFEALTKGEGGSAAAWLDPNE